MRVKISVLKKNCEHLKEISSYNSNYYKLPFIIDGCSILHESYNGEEVFCGNTIGNLVNGKYVVQLYLHSLDKEGQFEFDSNAMGKRNEWT